MRNEQATPDDPAQRILGFMRRAPQGHFTAVQLARNTGLALPEVQRRIAALQQDGSVVRSRTTVVPAFQLAEGPPTVLGRVTPREAADRQRWWGTN
jgi:DNA-binding IclR family transcriptional regulator